MTDYVIKILFIDDDTVRTIALPGLDLDQAEQYTADLREEVQEGKDVDAPVVQFARDGLSEITLEPSAVRSIDLQEAE